MYSHILVPTDGSELSQKAVGEAVQFARAVSARITFLYAQPDYPQLLVGEGAMLPVEQIDDYQRSAAAQAERVLKAAADVAREHGVQALTVTEVSDTPWRVIVGTAEAKGCDLIFMASHGRRGIASMLIGSETQRVLTHCTIPVLVYR